ncbi:MAG TPA: cytochrome c [Prolixibacteraceae bacterium]|nr:cytochrome c [Prolixibacteraceae bacterium]
MKKTLITIVLTLAVIVAGFFIYIYSGAYNISQLSPHNSLTKSIIGITTHHSIEKRLKDIVVPANITDTAVIVRGFKHYNEMCIGCHNAPDLPANKFVEGWYPKPPEIYKFVKEDDAREFFWITKYGIKMTSMPAFQPTVDDTKLWEVTAFVTQKLGKMKPGEYHKWVEKYTAVNKTDSTKHE